MIFRYEAAVYSENEVWRQLGDFYLEKYITSIKMLATLFVEHILKTLKKWKFHSASFVAAVYMVTFLFVVVCEHHATEEGDTVLVNHELLFAWFDLAVIVAYRGPEWLCVAVVIPHNRLVSSLLDTKCVYVLDCISDVYVW